MKKQFKSIIYSLFAMLLLQLTTTFVVHAGSLSLTDKSFQPNILLGSKFNCSGLNVVDQHPAQTLPEEEQLDDEESDDDEPDCD